MARRKILSREEYDVLADAATDVLADVATARNPAGDVTAPTRRGDVPGAIPAGDVPADSASEPLGVQIFKRDFEKVFGVPFPE